MTAKGCDSARARRHSPGPPTGRIVAAIPERRFSACRLMAKVLVSWQSMHAIQIYKVDVALQHCRSHQRHRPNIGRPSPYKGLTGRCICLAAA